MTSPTPESRSEILDRARTLLGREGTRFSDQTEVMLNGLPFTVMLVHFHESNEVSVYYDTPGPMFVVTTAVELPPELPFVCDDTADRVLKLMRARMVLDDIADS